MRITTLLLLAAFTLLPGIAPAQQCDDFDDVCTTNDMCSDGVCTGTFHAGGCDDGDPCTINDHCVMDENGIACVGTDPAPVGTACAGGCGTCEEFMGIPGFVQCLGDASANGNSCDAGFEDPCLVPKCSISGGFAFCFPEPKECPDTDGNHCNDVCDFETGQCETANSIVCDARCEACNPSTGACSPAHVGEACDDFDVCSPESSCQTINEIHRTFCLAGAATVATPTSTVGTGATPTRTPGTPGACVGDCDGGGSVSINELVLGVNISLGSAQISRCTGFDRNSSGAVEVSELVAAVNASLKGCV